MNKGGDIKNRVFITTDCGGDPDDTQSLIRAVMLHELGEVEIVGICYGLPSGDRKEVIGVLDAAERDNFKKARDLKKVVWQGAKKTGVRAPSRGATEIIRLANNGDVRPLLVTSWGAATDVACALNASPSLGLSGVRFFISGDWNRAQDVKAWEFCERILNKNNSIFSLTDHKKIYTGWPVNKNRKFVSETIKPCGHMGKLYYKASEGVSTGKFTLKEGDSGCFQWAVEYRGGPMEWKTQRIKILTSWKKIAKELYGNI
jgi:hypothetical protein